jgi:hypothetical protein
MISLLPQSGELTVSRTTAAQIQISQLAGIKILFLSWATLYLLLTFKMNILVINWKSGCLMSLKQGMYEKIAGM